MRLASVILDTDNAEKLASFYERLLGWDRKTYDDGTNGKWITLRKKDESTTKLVFQEIENYERPVWPEEKGKQQQMLHLDFYSNDVEKSVKHALKCGATLAKYQSGYWKVLIDPSGHPFCIVPERNK